MNKNKLNSDNHVLYYAILIFFVAIILIPIFWMLSTSFKTEAETFVIPPTFIPKEPTFQAYENMWIASDFVTYFKNSAIVTFFSVTISVVVSCLAGYGITRFNFKGKGAFLSFILLTQMFPSIMLLIPYYKILSVYGLKNSLLGLIIVYISFSIPFCSWMMVGYFKTIPLELDESAIIDGCTRFQAFCKIVLPLTVPGVASAAIYAFITAWNEYMFTQLIISDAALKTLPIAIGELNGFYEIRWNDLMAASVVSSIPLVIGFLFLQKYFISGLTAGAVKQ